MRQHVHKQTHMMWNHQWNQATGTNCTCLQQRPSARAWSPSSICATCMTLSFFLSPSGAICAANVKKVKIMSFPACANTSGSHHLLLVFSSAWSTWLWVVCLYTIFTKKKNWTGCNLFNMWFQQRFMSVWGWKRRHFYCLTMLQCTPHQQRCRGIMARLRQCTCPPTPLPPFYPWTKLSLTHASASAKEAACPCHLGEWPGRSVCPWCFGHCHDRCSVG